MNETNPLKSILIIDDDKTIRQSLIDHLEDQGYRVFDAVDGVDGLNKARTCRPDLIISDIMMPNMNGIDFFTALRSETPELAATPFIFLSAKAGKDDTLEGIRLGVDAYLTKPVSFELLMATIESKFSNQERQAELMKTKLETVFDSLFQDVEHAVGEYENLDVLLKHYSNF